MTVNVDVYVGNTTVVDPEIFSLWVNGFTEEEASSKLLAGNLYEIHITLENMKAYVADHYRTFQMMEQFLHNPIHLSDQLTFQLASQTQRMLMEKYYAIDDLVIREFLGKKLSSRNRKDLDEVSEKCGISTKSCRRQFDNVKRVYKGLEDCSGLLVNNIQNLFLLPERLARQYAAIAFFTSIKFETGKKKQNYLTLTDFIYCAQQMMSNWCGTRSESSDDNPLEMDRDFLQDLREVKVLLERDNFEDHRTLVLAHLLSKLSTKTMHDLENNFKVVSRAIITIACNLNQSKEMKDFFVDIVEKLIEPCRQAPWTSLELKHFFNSYYQCAINNILPQELFSSWDKYMKTLSHCVIQMYHS